MVVPWDRVSGICQLPFVSVVVVANARSRPTIEDGVEVPEKVMVLVTDIWAFCCGERREIYEIVLVASVVEKAVVATESVSTDEESDAVVGTTVDPPPKPGLMAMSGGTTVDGEVTRGGEVGGLVCVTGILI